jgi:hypothetical protein
MFFNSVIPSPSTPLRSAQGIFQRDFTGMEGSSLRSESSTAIIAAASSSVGAGSMQ